uniref:Uncharacterized protein n=1 Tax=Oryza punctata TaxID=4537 RepID=A0A0E0JKI4_ORYPU
MGDEVRRFVLRVNDLIHATRAAIASLPPAGSRPGCSPPGSGGCTKRSTSPLSKTIWSYNKDLIWWSTEENIIQCCLQTQCSFSFSQGESFSQKRGKYTHAARPWRAPSSIIEIKVEQSRIFPFPWRKRNKISRLGSSAPCAISLLNRGGGEQSRGGKGSCK